ncbi:hypothetical protein, partial [Aeromonas hydrophila]|uniref:hypothetical protein n=1 Tax=Aeromonas hydrophila TaxID=644 RepID=UPI0036D9B859
ANAEVAHQGTGRSIKKSDMAAGDLLLISEDIASFLADGLNVTASVRNSESGLLANESFGDVIIFYRDGSLWFDRVKEFNSDFPLSDEAKELLSNLRGQAFDARGRLVVNDSLS